MTSIFSGQGYFFNDDRASGGVRDEDDLLGCGHCSKLLKKSQWKEKGGMCMACNKPMCAHCTHRAVNQGFGCEGPEVKRIEAAVNEAYRREQNAKALGI